MQNQSLQRLFRLWTAFVILVPSIMMIAIYATGQINAAKQDKLEVISQRVDFQKRLIEFWIDERARDVRSLARQEAFRRLDEKEMAAALRFIQQEIDDFDSLSFINADGFFAISTLNQGIRFSSAAGQPYYQAALLRKDYISDIVIGRNSGLPIINFASPVVDDTGDFRGVILGSVRTATIEKLLRDNWIGKTGEILLVNRDAVMLAEPRYASILVEKGLIEGNSRMKVKLSKDALKTIRIGEDGSAYWNDYLDQQVLGAYRHIPDRGWTIVGSISENEVLEPVYEQVKKVAISAFLLLLLILPIAAKLSDWFKKPLDWLIDQVSLMASNNYQYNTSLEVTSRTPLEIKVLCHTFGKMAREINHSVTLLKEKEAILANKLTEIQDINASLRNEIMERQSAQKALSQLSESLETKVIARTKQLETTNRILKDEIKDHQITQEALREKTQELLRLAYFDSLTGLPNRVQLYELLAKEMKPNMSKPATGAILYIDIDNFKTLNDCFGHSVGDKVIIEAGRRIVEAIGDLGFVGRISGDAFIAVLPNISDRDEITLHVSKILKELSKEIERLDIGIHITASIGIAIYPADGETVQEVCRHADNAVYAAKQMGKRSWCFYEIGMQAETYGKIVLVNSLRKAIEKGEMLLHYQPEVDSVTGSVVGFEALLRWNSPEHGQVPPNKFVPLLEQNGLIQQFGRWVLYEALMFARRLKEAGWGEVRVAVNVSPHQIISEDFVRFVKVTLMELAIDSNQLELEITESILIDSPDEFGFKLEELRNLGINISLDDFGKGFSSLTHITSIPVHVIKIDKSFIDLLNPASTKLGQGAIVKSMIDLAHNLDLITVAEGVETQYQLDYLKRYKCDRIQGYLISKPIPEDEAFRFLAQSKIRFA